jgi:hypothetical protein
MTGMDGVIAVNDEAVTENSIREALQSLADMLEVHIETTARRLNRIEQLAVTVDKKVDHLDGQAHELRQFIDAHRPALDAGMKRLAVLTDPMAALRNRTKPRK